MNLSRFEFVLVSQASRRALWLDPNLLVQLFGEIDTVKTINSPASGPFISKPLIPNNII
jgi:hypothetical protein